MSPGYTWIGLDWIGLQLGKYPSRICVVEDPFFQRFNDQGISSPMYPLDIIPPTLHCIAVNLNEKKKGVTPRTDRLVEDCLRQKNSASRSSQKQGNNLPRQAS